MSSCRRRGVGTAWCSCRGARVVVDGVVLVSATARARVVGNGVVLDGVDGIGNGVVLDGVENRFV
jgi:hypothetical protein